jgi:hypothetical protein
MPLWRLMWSGLFVWPSGLNLLRDLAQYSTSFFLLFNRNFRMFETNESVQMKSILTFSFYLIN